MRSRIDFSKLLLSNNLTGYGVELGSFEGQFAKNILSSWPGNLYMIDVWRTLPSDEYDDISNQYDYLSVIDTAIKNIQPYEDRAHIIRMKGKDAVNLFNDNMLDFVYIDANHTYEAVIDDINMWYPKVKSGGIVSGHDYLPLQCDYNKENYDKNIKNIPINMWSNSDPTKIEYVGMFGVNPAVEEFTTEHNYKFNVTPDDWNGTWWFIKR